MTTIMYIYDLLFIYLIYIQYISFLYRIHLYMWTFSFKKTHVLYIVIIILYRHSALSNLCGTLCLFPVRGRLKTSARIAPDEPVSRSGDRKAHEDSSPCRETGMFLVRLVHQKPI